MAVWLGAETQLGQPIHVALTVYFPALPHTSLLI
jgi:hypothetical protein